MYLPCVRFGVDGITYNSVHLNRLEYKNMRIYEDVIWTTWLRCEPLPDYWLRTGITELYISEWIHF